MNNVAVMYHYVQKKGLKGIVPLDPDDFKIQIDWLCKHYEIISPDDMETRVGGKPFCVLTFDDATKDQYEVAFDILKKKGIPAYFTVMSGPLTGHIIPVVHLVHSVLSYYSDQEVWMDINELFELDNIPYIIGDNYAYESDPFRRYNKYALNFVLTEKQSRSYLEQKLLTGFKNIDAFIDQYYITLDEWKKIKEAGMTIGVHAVNHRAFGGNAQSFFDEEIAPCQEYIRKSLAFDPKWYTPAFGGGIAYKEMMDQLEPILRKEGFKGGFTTQHGYINQDKNVFWFQRIDCVNLPPLKRYPGV
ncbi:polysaccharide deacetylase family protein [Paenibacillus azoreducens]|uniref:polysaccharide deacetylase family protein n=1 Tax=Paenibacillus azoreducens TaxID=116718 RepID=UPI0039F5B17A